MGENCATSALEEEATQLGFAASILMDTDRREVSIASLWTWVRPAIRLQQIELLFGAEGRPLAFATWAYVTEETASRLRSGAAPMLDDWNDGDLLWVVDFVAPYGHARALATRLRARMAGRFREAHGVARGREQVRASASRNVPRRV